MISIILLTTFIIYYIIGNYIFFIPSFFLYYNYYKNTKLLLLDKDIEEDKSRCKIKSKIYKNIKYFFNKTDKKINIYNEDKITRILSDDNTKFKNIYIYIIKIDNVILYIINEFLLFILFYMKQLIKFIIANQFSSTTNIINKKTNIKIEDDNIDDDDIDDDDIDDDNIKDKNIKEKKKNLLELINKKYT